MIFMEFLMWLVGGIEGGPLTSDDDDDDDDDFNMSLLECLVVRVFLH
jgi:hypothetical protein